jgi:hypothetical protein
MDKSRVSRLCGLLLMAGLVIADGCTRAVPDISTTEVSPVSPSITSAPPSITTPNPTNLPVLQLPTNTPGPTPLIDLTHGFREWLPEPILIQVGIIHDLKRDPFDRDPSFVLYADGTLIQKSCEASSCDFTSTQLNTKQICSLLNTIELYGFFDYDPSGYNTPIVGGEITYLEVKAWREQSIALYQLTDWLDDPNWLNRLLDCSNCREPPLIKPALGNTYWLLDGYSVPGSVPYHPPSLAVWLSAPELAGEPVDWTLGSPTLGRLAEMSRCAEPGQRQAIVLSGSEAENLAGFINQTTNQGLSPIFSEGLLTFQVTTRWLLPYEQAAGCGESTNQFPAADIPLMKTPMSCRVSDGLIPTVTPTLYY